MCLEQYWLAIPPFAAVLLRYQKLNLKFPKSYLSVQLFQRQRQIEVLANNTDSGESARNELSHLKSALFAF